MTNTPEADSAPAVLSDWPVPDSAMHAWREEVRRLYRAVLKTDPKPAAIEQSAADLSAGRIFPSDLVSELLSRKGENLEQAISKATYIDDLQTAQEIVRDIYRVLFLREADESGLATFSAALSSGRLTIMSLIGECVNSDEFSRRYRQNERDVKSYVRASIQAAFGRSATMQELETYAEGIHDENGFALFLESILNADEARSRISPAQNSVGDQNNPGKLVEEAFHVLLLRDVDEGALHSFSQSVANGDLTFMGLIRELVASEEFGRCALRLAPVSRHVVVSVINTMIRRQPDVHTLNAYINAVQGGLTLESLISEMINSPEFHSIMSSEVTKSGLAGTVPVELAKLAEDLLVTRMVAEGCRIAAPPHNSPVSRRIPEKQLAALIRTLAMMNEVRRPR